MSANSTEVIRSAAAGPWSLALPSGLALLAFAMGLAEKPPLSMARSSANVYNDLPNLTPLRRRRGV